MLYYCDKCGLIRNRVEQKVECEFCHNNMLIVPQDYYAISCCMNSNEDEHLREELVKTSSNYDKELFNQRYYWEIELNNRSHSNLQKIKAVQQQASNIPKCPTCQSTNVRKMGGVERGASIWAFGIFSKKINKTFKCESCSYTW